MVRDGGFAADRMWRSLEGSLERLDVDGLQVLYLHDAETASTPSWPLAARWMPWSR